MRKSRRDAPVRFTVDKNKYGKGYTVTAVRQKMQKPAVFTSRKLVSRQQSEVSGSNMQQEAPREEEEKNNRSAEASSHADAGSHKTVRKQEMAHLAYLSGQRVIARDKHDGMYYEGVVVSCPNPRYARVRRYFDEKIMKISTKFILPIRGAVSNPPLRVGDYVLVRVINLINDTDCYIPGIIQIPSEKIASFYSVLVYNSQTIVTRRRHMVKISKERFDFTVDYICQILREEKDIYIEMQQPLEPDVKFNGEGKGRGNSEEGVENTQDSKRGQKKLSDHTNEKDNKGRKKHQNMSRHKSEKHHSEDSCPPSLSQSPCRTNSITSNIHTASEYDTDVSTNEREMEELQADHNDNDDDDDNDYNDDSDDGDGDSSSRRDPTPNIVPHHTVLNPNDSLTAKLKEQEEKLHKLQKQLQDQDQKHREEQQEVRKTIEDLRNDQKERRLQGGGFHHLDESVTDVGQRPSATEARDLTGSGALTPHEEDKHTSQMLVNTRKKDTRQTSLALLEMRKSLTPIKEGEQVLARWMDEGWYYRGRVVLNCQDFSYMVVDSTGEAERIWREDIITESDDANRIINVDDTVIGLHPSYSFSYAPAFIIELLSHLNIRARFYDNKIAVLQRDEVYKIPQVKYRHDIREIHKCENEWVGQAVVARDDLTGVYRIGTVIEKVPAKPEYRVEWSDGTSSMQSPVHMLGAFTRRHKLALGERILALRDYEALTYLPGVITGMDGSTLQVQFCDGAIMNGIVADESYWLSVTYYDSAVSSYRDAQRKNNPLL